MSRPGWLDDLARLDVAVYAAVGATPTPALDEPMRRLSRAADRSKLNLAAAAVLAVAGGRDGRAAARAGVVSLAAASVVVNAVAKPLARRRRPERDVHAVPAARHVRMPTSRSLPSGHSASAFAFATAAGQVLPYSGAPLRLLAVTVAYSRVHTGVHYPGDVIAGALLGATIAQATTRATSMRR
jgi:membrane-associated phospholipid phosphatase